jgi:hypothetical protein
MSTGILITVCVLLLSAYVFDITAARTRIPFASGNAGAGGG